MKKGSQLGAQEIRPIASMPDSIFSQAGNEGHISLAAGSIMPPLAVEDSKGTTFQAPSASGSQPLWAPEDIPSFAPIQTQELQPLKSEPKRANPDDSDTNVPNSHQNQASIPKNWPLVIAKVTQMSEEDDSLMNHILRLGESPL